MSDTRSSNTLLTVLQAGALQRSVFKASDNLRSMREYAVSISDSASLPVIEKLLENGHTYSMFLEELMTPSVPRSPDDEHAALTMVEQVREHCALVDKAYAEQASEVSG